MKRMKLRNNLRDIQLDIVGIPMYIDLEEFLDMVSYEVNDSVTEEEDKGLQINAPKYEILKLLLDVLLSDTEIVDDGLGIRALKQSTIPFKLSLNTLINYNIIKEIKN